MTKNQRRDFIEELLVSVRESIMNDVEKMPAEWDGHELRQLIADRFAAQVMWPLGGNTKKRVREYRNTVIVQNL